MPRFRHVRLPRALRAPLPIALAALALLAWGAATTPLRGQADDAPRLLRAEPGGFVVTTGSAEVALDLYGENLWDADRLWTERNIRVYARHASGDDPWLRLFTGSGDIGSGGPEDASEALP
ncbi:MAG TPA: hypothetical protein VFQ07_11455, partial [Candidatus Polarisedimenticolia bacterium]|nr:hypothetical protein [Candidatus Polarisedimenticolia bacterium]